MAAHVLHSSWFFVFIFLAGFCNASPCGCRSTAELKAPEDLIVSVGMGASFLDVAVIAPTRIHASTSDDAATVGGVSASKKKKGKGGGGGGGTGAGAAESMEYRVTALAGDSACGGLDMDYLVARALLVRRIGVELRGVWGGGLHTLLGFG